MHVCTRIIHICVSVLLLLHTVPPSGCICSRSIILKLTPAHTHPLLHTIQMTPQSDSEPLKVYTLSPFALAHALSPPSPLPLAFLLHSFSCSAACARVSLLVVSKFTNLLFRVERAVVILTTQFLLRVLQVHTPFFCTKTIGQSTPYPLIIHTTPCARAPLPTGYVSALDDSQYVISYVLLHCRVA